MDFPPEDLAWTTPALFLTRWITHLCAPAFMFLAGAAIALTWLRYGAAPFLLVPPPTLGTPRERFPADYGWDLWVTDAVTALVVAALGGGERQERTAGPGESHER